MAKRKPNVPVKLRERLMDQIEAEIDAAAEHVRIANDITDLINLLDPDEPKIKKRDNLILGAFEKEPAKQ